MNKIKNPPFFFLFAWWSTVVYSTSWSYTTHIDLKLLLLLLLLLQQTALVCKEGRRVSFGNRIASSTWRKRWKKKKEESFFFFFYMQRNDQVYSHHHLHLPQSVCRAISRILHHSTIILVPVPFLSFFPLAQHSSLSNS